MRTNSSGTFAALALCILAVSFLSSCASSRGSTLGKVIATEAGGRRGESTPTYERPSPNPPESKKGLEVISDPDNAEVWIDGAFRGLSPYIAEDLSSGWHRITLRKSGYYEASSWVDFESDYMLYQASLVQMTGYLQISVSPQESIVSVGGQDMAPGLLQLRVGSYSVRVRLFGYTDYQESISIEDKAVTTMVVTLQPAEFAISAFSVPKPAVNPENPGLLGTLEVNFSVTGPGTGEIRVDDERSMEAFSQALPEFTAWEQSFTWNVRDASGNALPDGTYTLRVMARGKGADEAQTEREATIRIDRTLKVAPRSLWSGSAGLLYAPVAEVLPSGDFQVAVLGAGIVVGDPPFFQAPIQLGARVGLGSSLEIDASAGLIPSSVALPFAASVAARWNLVSPHGAYGTASAVEAKLSVQYNPQPDGGAVLMTDTFANFTGLSIELPFQLSLGAVNLMLSAGATGSFWYPYRARSDGTPLQGFVGWLYLRAGAMVELGSVMAGLSASTRTEPLPGGIAFLSSPIPFQLGAEVHWLIPGTRLFLSGMVAGEYEDSANYYFMGGGGLGFLY
jgi:hypothetical protein